MTSPKKTLTPAGSLALARAINRHLHNHNPKMLNQVEQERLQGQNQNRTRKNKYFRSNPYQRPYPGAFRLTMGLSEFFRGINFCYWKPLEIDFGKYFSEAVRSRRVAPNFAKIIPK